MTWSVCSSSGWSLMFCACGGSALNPAKSAGVTTMKMISSTSMTSTIGVTFGEDCTPPPPPPVDIAIRNYLLDGMGLLRDRAGAAGCVELAGEARPTELARHALDEVVDHFLRHVRHLSREVVDLRGEVVVRPHRRDGDEKTEGRRDERFSDTTADRRETAGTRGGHAREGVHDAHGGTEQSDERRGCTHRREHGEAALQIRDLEEHVALDRTFGRVDVGDRDRAVGDEGLHF